VEKKEATRPEAKMKILAANHTKTALYGIRQSHWRSLLTMLGVIIGISSVVTIVSLGEGIKHQIVGQIDNLGNNLITVRPGSIQTNTTTGALSFLNIFAGLNDSTLLNIQDVKTIQQTPGVRLAVPMSIISGPIQSSGQLFDTIPVIGSTADIPAVLNQTLQYGSFYSTNDSITDSAVLGQNVANELYPGDSALGHSFTFHGESFVVRGVLNQFDIAPLSVDADFNNVIFIPYSTAQQLDPNNAPLYEILVKPSSSSSTNSVVSKIKSNLLLAHHGEQNFSVFTQTDELTAANHILDLLTELISGIAAISLLVGGIGIMNVMLVAVTERTQEIGIRKALGATSRQIINQFLTEAVVISTYGGILGIIVSVLINLGLRIVTNLQPALSWQVMLLATAVSVIVGLVFGIMPAVKAARKDPIDTLRYQ
jgi:ABC-type antimicrobial peptide transport system permease subunit